MSDSTITHRCQPGTECFCVYDPDCNPAVKAGVEARVDRVADCLAVEMGVWISAHPNAGLFDWDVLAREVLRVADTHPTSREDR